MTKPMTLRIATVGKPPLVDGFGAVVASNRNVSALTRESRATRAVTIEVAEGHADVYKGGEKVGITPFRIEGKPGEELQLVLKANGFVDKAVKLSVGQQDKPYTFTLERK